MKPESLTYVETKDLSTLVELGDGVAIYDFIQQSIDLRYGSVQDKLRRKYNEMKVTPTDNIATVSKQVDLKWFLHCHHTLYDVSTAHGRKEGIREILTMLPNGPGNIATEAILALTHVDTLDWSGMQSGEDWVRNRLDNYKRYGTKLIGAKNPQGNLMYMGDKDTKRNPTENGVR